MSGAVGNQSKAAEQKIEGSEKKQAGQKEHGDLRVNSLKMVSDTCAK